MRKGSHRMARTRDAEDRSHHLMIARVWKGWTKVEDADAYEELLRKKVLPALRRIAGYQGGHVLRQDGKDEVEFVVVNFFESFDAVRSFAGPDYAVPVFEPEARKLLSKVEPIARHYQVKVTSSGWKRGTRRSFV